MEDQTSYASQSPSSILSKRSRESSVHRLNAGNLQNSVSNEQHRKEHRSFNNRTAESSSYEITIDFLLLGLSILSFLVYLALSLLFSGAFSIALTLALLFVGSYGLKLFSFRPFRHSSARWYKDTLAVLHAQAYASNRQTQTHSHN